jgi:hypothetical protein
MFIIANCSSRRQVRWADCIVPNKEAAKLPNSGFVGGVFFQKANFSRPCGTTFHVLADVAGDMVLTTSGIPAETTLTPALSKLAPNPAEVQLELQVGTARSPFSIVGSQGIGSHRVRLHLRAVCAGFVADLWTDLRSFQDLVDICGRITWSDPSNPGAWSPVPGSDVRIHVAQGNWHIDYATRWSLETGGFGIDAPTLPSFPDAMSMPFYGHWTPAYPPLVPPDDPLAFFWQQRLQTAVAATEGPLVAMWDDQDGNWFAQGSLPPVVSNPPSMSTEWTGFKALLAQPGNIYDQRRFASPLNTGQTGDIEAFGLMKDYLLLRAKDPRRIYQLRESAVDYLLRCHHHAEADGSPVLEANHHGLFTWNLCTFHTGSDLLGKAYETPPPPFGFGRPFVDDEHRADTYVAAVRHVTDDPLLEADLQDRIQMDLARAFRRNHWVPTPRASGRLLQSWAMAWWTTGSDQSRKDLHQLSIDEFALRSTVLQTNTGPVARASLGPVRPANVISTDSRVIDGGPAWVPWNDACLLTGLWHQIALWEGQGADADLAAQMKAHFLEVAETMLLYGTVRGAADGYLYPLNGVLWLPNGEPNPPEFYTFPRAGASFGDDAWDMLVGTPGWYGTLGWPTVVKGYLKIGKNDKALVIAKEIAQVNLQTPTVHTAEWLAV